MIIEKLATSFQYLNLSIPIVLGPSHSYYKAISVTIDMKTGERLFLEDIIELNEEFVK
jgi:hypothetical protein